MKEQEVHMSKRTVRKVQRCFQVLAVAGWFAFFTGLLGYMAGIFPPAAAACVSGAAVIAFSVGIALGGCLR